VPQRVLGPVHQLRLDAVEQPPPDIASRADEQDHDRGGDDQPDDRIGQRKPGQDTDPAEHHGERGESVGAGVDAIGDQRRRPDPPAGTDPVDGDDLVAEEPDHSRGDHPAQVIQWTRIDQPIDGLPGRDDGRQRDHEDDEEPGEIFGTAQPERVAPGGGTPAQSERDPQRDGGQRVGQVVHGVGEQGHGTADRHDHRLPGRRDQQDQQTELERTDALSAGLECVIDRIGRIMAVRDEDLGQELANSCGVPMTVMIMAVMVIMMIVAVPMITGRARSHGDTSRSL
jgi:hypothetical protein